MKSILYVGLDVHTTNYTICTYEPEYDRISRQVQVGPDYKYITKYVDRLKKEFGAGVVVKCGYEAGCLGYSLYRQLTAANLDCEILAPTTMARPVSYPFKNDKRDAAGVARCLATHAYSPVHVPTVEDESVKEYIRMRDDHVNDLKRTKQQIIAFCTRHGKKFTEGKSYWTKKHLDWLKKLDMGNAQLNETLSEYRATFYLLKDKVERFDARIEEIAKEERYAENVKKLCCFLGIKPHTALSIITEVGDFKRFETANKFSAYLGLVPGENSSANRQRHLGITKAGNRHLRTLLTEASQCFNRSPVGYKSKELSERQKGNPSEIIDYADKANERLRRKYISMRCREKNHNVIVAAVARELACFIWGMMTGHISLSPPTLTEPCVPVETYSAKATGESE